VDDELMVDFVNSGQQKKSVFQLFRRNGQDEASNTSAQLEITIRATDDPEGISRLTEGYEKVLRAQMPH
jgi:hypothetical protein